MSKVKEPVWIEAPAEPVDPARVPSPETLNMLLRFLPGLMTWNGNAFSFTTPAGVEVRMQRHRIGGRKSKSQRGAGRMAGTLIWRVGGAWQIVTTYDTRDLIKTQYRGLIRASNASHVVENATEKMKIEHHSITFSGDYDLFGTDFVFLKMFHE